MARQPAWESMTPKLCFSASYSAHVESIWARIGAASPHVTPSERRAAQWACTPSFSRTRWAGAAHFRSRNSSTLAVGARWTSPGKMRCFGAGSGVGLGGETPRVVPESRIGRTCGSIALAGNAAECCSSAKVHKVAASGRGTWSAASWGMCDGLLGLRNARIGEIVTALRGPGVARRRGSPGPAAAPRASTMPVGAAGDHGRRGGPAGREKWHAQHPERRLRQPAPAAPRQPRRGARVALPKELRVPAVSRGPAPSERGLRARAKRGRRGPLCRRRGAQNSPPNRGVFEVILWVSRDS